MKKLFCLLLAMVMVFTLAACGENGDENTTPNGGTVNNGGGNENQGTDGSKPTEPEDETVWVLTKEYVNSSDYIAYEYDEQGNLTGASRFDGSEKAWGYQFEITDTAEGGKKYVATRLEEGEDPFLDFNLYFDKEGRLIRYEGYDPLEGVLRGSYTEFTYDDNGFMTEQAIIGSDGEVDEKIVYVYSGEKLTEAHYTKTVRGEYADFWYRYSDDGILAEMEMKAEFSGSYSEVKFPLEVKEENSFGESGLTAGNCDDRISGQSVIRVDKNTDDDGNVRSLILEAKGWTTLKTGWVPTVQLGCLSMLNYFTNSVKLEYVPLDVYLAEKS